MKKTKIIKYKKVMQYGGRGNEVKKNSTFDNVINNNSSIIKYFR